MPMDIGAQCGKGGSEHRVNGKGERSENFNRSGSKGKGKGNINNVSKDKDFGRITPNVKAKEPS